MRRIHSIIVSTALVLAANPVFASEPTIPTPKANPSADDQQRGDDLFENGRALYQDGSYESAITAFKSAYELTGDPVLLYNIALAYDRMDAFDEAIEYLEAYRAVAPAEERDQLSEKVDSLRRRKLRAQTIAEENNAANGTSPTPTTANESKAPADQPANEPKKPSDRIFGPAAITLTVITAVAAGVGIGLGVASLRRKNRAEDQCSSGADGGLFCPDTAAKDIDQARKFAIGADVSIAIAGAAGVALIAVIAAKAAKRNKQKRQVALVPSRGGAGVSLAF